MWRLRRRRHMARKELSKLQMPMKKKEDMEGDEMLQELDMGEGEEEEAPELEDESSPADMSEDMSELANLSDDDLLAECEKRGLKVEKAAPEEENTDAIPEEITPEYEKAE
jgi:hypothetical protein